MYFHLSSARAKIRNMRNRFLLLALCVVLVCFGIAGCSEEAPTEDGYLPASSHLWTGAKIYFGEQRTYIFEVLGGNENYVSPSGDKIRGLKVRYPNGNEEWKDRNALISGNQYWVKADDPALKEERWEEFDAHDPFFTPASLPTPSVAATAPWMATIRVDGYVDPRGAESLDTSHAAPGTTSPKLPTQAKVNGQIVNLPYVKTQQVKVGDNVGVRVEEVLGTLGGHDQVTISIDPGTGDRAAYTKTTQDEPNNSLFMTYRVPDGRATASCIDGTLSYAENPQGDCSNHGGVYQRYAGMMVDDE
jgi:hypothetical protein